jgi:hypothetical protein
LGSAACQSSNSIVSQSAADAAITRKADAAGTKAGDASTLITLPDAGFAPISIDGGARSAIDAGTPGAEANCLPTVTALRPRPAEVLLVQDRSTTMAEPLAAGSKWSASAAAVASVAGLGTANWGMMLFPKAYSDGECCQMPASGLPADIEVAPSAASAAALATTFEQKAATGIGRPMARAITQAADYLSARTTSTAKYLVVAAAGEPTCSGDGLCSAASTSDATRTKDAVTHAASRLGIPVAVVAIGLATSSNALQPSATQQLFADLAKLGGMPNTAPGQPGYWAAGTTDELASALSAIAAQAKSCSFALPTTFNGNADAQVSLSDVRLSRDSTRQDGWDFSDDGTSLVLYGKACTAARTASGAVTLQLQPSCSVPPVL